MLKRLIIIFGLGLVLLTLAAPMVLAQEVLVERYYITPYISMWNNGDGTFDTVDGIRPVNGPAVLLTGVWNTGARTSSVIPISARGRARGTAITWVFTTEAHHTAIQSDTQNILVPFTPEDLDQPYSSLSAQEQSGLESYLDSIFMDTGWLQQTTPLRSIMAYFLHVQFAGQQLGSDYPDRALTTRWNGIDTNEQAAVTAFLAERGRPAVSGNPQLREVVNNMAQIVWNAGGISFAGQFFPSWSP